MLLGMVHIFTCHVLHMLLNKDEDVKSWLLHISCGSHHGVLDCLYISRAMEAMWPFADWCHMYWAHKASYCA
ncbi:hypothetical protein RLOC_00007311 [Lonchura striata]|uniref:Uncharacterized protein n=1 Tax=Lonchura striata TaxID=40157 RepID=A0A218VBS8_9PASE|nr:hypothetical protein RLOC_00007311 [Lonchura striata domestica]